MARKGQSEKPEKVTNQLVANSLADPCLVSIPPSHVVALRKKNPKIFESLTTVNHHLHCLHRYKSETTIALNDKSSLHQ